MRRTYTGAIEKLEPNQIFVFGSNTEGKHGKGAARWAVDNAGARYGRSRGRQGQSYAIVTKDLTKTVHPSIKPFYIMEQIERLYEYASLTPEMAYLIAYNTIGNNLNGYTAYNMALMFATVGLPFKIPNNIVFEENFNTMVEEILLDDRNK